MNDDEMCAACIAYLAHYPIMNDGDWQCDHGENELAFMRAMGDAIHGPNPEGEFVDADWRAACFLEDAELAFDCGAPPYSMRITHNVDPFSFMALVNERYLVGVRNEEGAESEFIADLGWLGLATSSGSDT